VSGTNSPNSWACYTQKIINAYCIPYNITITSNLDHRVKTRLQVQVKRNPSFKDPNPADDQHYTSTLDAINKIMKDDGVAGLYAGMAGSLIGVASTNFAYFYWYTIVRTLYISSQKVSTPPSTAIELSLGAVAGAIAQLFTIPVAVVTTRQQTVSKAERKGLIATGREVVNSEDGWTGLWRGLKASLVLVVNPAITYGAYQRLREVIFPGKTNLRPWEAFSKHFIVIKYALTNISSNSSWLDVEGSCNNCNSAPHRRKGWPAIEAPPSTERKAFQKLW
jgi:Mitochondrial carrier protein